MRNDVPLDAYWQLRGTMKAKPWLTESHFGGSGLGQLGWRAALAAVLSVRPV